MSVSGHTAESSLQNYAMTSSTAKENMSHAISATVDPKSVPSSSNISHGFAAAVDPNQYRRHRHPLVVSVVKARNSGN